MNSENGFSTLITENAAMKEIIRTAERAAESNVNILLTGESGTGKNIIARAIHHSGRWSAGPYIPINCLAIPDTLIESELFGHEKGAFTDAYALKKGSFEAASGGTLYLDEIGDMALTAQGKILQAIEDGCFRRVGGEKLMVFNARIIAATNQDLSRKIGEGKFREDLYYRLKEVCLYLPPLRERKEDIPELVRYFIRHYCQVYGKRELSISKTALSNLLQYSWPGNIRELENVVKTAVALCTKETLWLEHFPFELKPKVESAEISDNNLSIGNLLSKHILNALNHFNWNKRKTANALGISRPRLDRYLRKFHLSRTNPE